MEKKRIQINKEYILIFAGAFFLTLAFYGYYMHPTYSFDGYLQTEYTAWPHNYQLAFGRPIADLVMNLVYATRLYPLQHQALYALVSILLISLCILLVYRMIMKKVEELSFFGKLVVFGAIAVFFLNIFYQEWFNYPETIPIFISSAVFAVLAATFFSEKKYILSVIFFLAAMETYQAELSVFIAFSSLALLLELFAKKAKIKEVMIRWGILLGISAGGVLCNLLITKIAGALNLFEENVRPVSLNTDLIRNNLKNAIGSSRYLLIDGYEHLPKYFIITILIIMLVLLTVLCVKERKAKAIWKLLIALMMMVVSYVSVFAVFFAAEAFWMPPRTMPGGFCILTMAAVLCVYQIEKTGNLEAVKIVCMSVLGGTIVLVLGVNLFHIQKQTIDLMNTNELDYQIAQQIDYEIEKYEMESGNQITAIRYYGDTNMKSHYDHVTTEAFDTNMRAYVVKWCLEGFFKYATGREYTVDLMTEEEYHRFFEEKDWPCFIPDEQVKCEGNTAYLVMD